MTIRDLLLDTDQDARTRAHGLESTGKLPPGFCEQHYGLLAHEQRELRRLKHAMAIATDAETFVALARGQAVHPSRLDPAHVRALQRR